MLWLRFTSIQRYIKLTDKDSVTSIENTILAFFVAIPCSYGFIRVILLTDFTWCIK